MRLNTIKPAAGARTVRTRVGRGIGSGLGKTAGRGHKGSYARTGKGKIKPGFEGGQMPIQRRLPKVGFVPRNKKEWAEISLDDLNRFAAGSLVDEAALREKGLVKGVWTGVKILGNGKIDRKLELKVNRITKSAKEAVEKAGCKLELVADQIKWQRPDTRAVRRTAKKK